MGSLFIALEGETMSNWITPVKRGLVGGSVASVLSTAALAALGKREAGSPFAPTNAISHWFYGNKAALQDKPSFKYTATGFAIHHASSLFWAVLLERLAGKILDRKQPLTTLEVGAATAAVACFADYQLTPQRLQPGYEMRLSRPSLAVVYGAFGVGLALGAMLCRRAG
jgi:hypothetical protein